MAEFVTSDISSIMSNPVLAEKIRAFRTGNRNEVLTEEGPPMPDEFDYASLAGVIHTSLNCYGDVPEQKVRVEYLSLDQFLVLPQALGINPVTIALSEARYDENIVRNYHKVARMTYADIYNIMNAAGNLASKLEAYERVNVDPLPPGRPAWLNEGYYVRVDGAEDDIGTVNFIFGLLSRMLKLNCDIRDTGALVGMKEYMRMGDAEWVNPLGELKTRLTSKLMPYTMHMIAALNMPACANFSIGAWVRSFGVGCGVLPSRDTVMTKEWKYTSSKPTTANILATDGEIMRLKGKLNSLCLNLLAMFGLLHLNKNHTFITGDKRITRICKSYINTLRTMVPVPVIGDLEVHMEVTCRTAAHPFGLGQTYCVAQILHQISGLSPSLDLLVTVTPPLTQRLMIVSTAAAEWENLPVGKSMSRLFYDSLKAIRNEIIEIKKDPPHYSELHRYYGYNDMKLVNDGAKSHVNAMMPFVGGYANVMHVDDNGNRDGIALAMSFLNVKRDSKVVTAAYTALWNKYLNALEEKDLNEFMKQAFAMKSHGARVAESKWI